MTAKELAQKFHEEYERFEPAEWRPSRMLVYVAGPLTGDSLAAQAENVVAAMKAGHALLTKGHAPVIPHLSHFFDEWISDYGLSVDYETYLEWDFALLRKCSAMLFLGPSPGASRERALAEEMGMPIYTRLEDVPDATGA